jgi:hypothetical protein
MALDEEQLPAGSVLFESGSTPDGVYLVANGRLGVKTLGITRLTAEIERGGLVGETPLFPIASKSTWPISRPDWSRNSRVAAAPDRTSRNSLAAELERRLAATIPAG